MSSSEGYTPHSIFRNPFSNNNLISQSPPSAASSVRSLRKRHSFFGRSNSDASRSRQGSTPQTSICEEESQEQQQNTSPRTLTSQATTEPSLRRLAEPLQSIRNSIFGGRKNEPIQPKKEDAQTNTTPPPSRSAQFSAVPNWSRQHFSTKEDYDQFLAKKTISPPFRFEHVTHTTKSQLPALETVDEKDLPGEFWSVSTYQTPRRHLNGIKADDLHDVHREMGIERLSPSSRPTSPRTLERHEDRPVLPETLNIGSLDETMFDGVKETRFDTNDGIRASKPTDRVLQFPRRLSSLNALNVLLPPEAPDHEKSDRTFEDYSLQSSHESEVPSDLPVNDAELPVDIPNFPMPPKATSELRQGDIAFRARQPLPPLPPPKPAKRASQTSVKTKRTAPASNMALVIPVQQSSSLRSRRSSRSSQSACKSLTLSTSTLLSDATWEEDVDFCYEQAAESTCNFDWDGVHDLHRDDGNTSPYHAYSPTISNDIGTHFGSRTKNETIAERRRSRAAARRGNHKHVPSVGHRGFLAARKSSTDLYGMCKTHAALSQTASSPTQVSVISPVFSVTTADEKPQKTPITPGTMHFPGFDGLNSFYLSDPESCRNSGSSNHRKSSSYDSHESSARLVQNAAKDTNRWSVASASSLPELMHGRPKSKLFISKTIISAPLETLPQSPPIEAHAEESSTVPRELQTQPCRSSFLLRRPQTPGDRASFRSTAKAAQPRSAGQGTSHRKSRVLQTYDGVSVLEAPSAGPRWI